MPNRQQSDAVLISSCLSCAPGASGWRWVRPLSRRAVLGPAAGLALASVARRASAVQSVAPAFSYPMGIPGRTLGDGFIVRHGYCCENTIVQTGWWHTAEDWYVTEGETGGSRVNAVAAGEVVFAGYDYPGLVIIIQHGPDLFSSYGHLNYDDLVQVGDFVERGALIGTIQTRVGRRVPSHLHFELRNFLINPVVNGQRPSYGVHCGVNCPPGPGYWPIAAPELPSAMGWRNPTHVINTRAYEGGILLGTDVVATALTGELVELWSAPPDQDGAIVTGELAVQSGERFRLLAVEVGLEASTETSAEGYHVWYQIMAGGERAWVQAAVPSFMDTGSDGRPSGVTFAFLLDAPAE
ncbi:MAG: peptidase domain protein [Thermomicrobiales bacterium]|nr:peptidase domain protein [Thermomicrobiales bacterium]